MAKTCQKLPMLVFLAIFRPLTGNKTLPNYFFLAEEVLSFDFVGHIWKSVKNWLQKWVFKIYKWKCGRSRWIAYFENYLQKWFGDRYGEFPTAFPARFSCKIFPQDFPQDFPARFSHKIFLQEFPARISCKIFPQEFPTRFPARFSHKIFPQEFPTRFPTRFSCKIFPTRFSRAGSWLVGSPSPYSKC